MKTFGQTVNLQLLQPTLYILLSCSGVTEGDFTVLQDAAERVGSFQEVLDSTSLVTMWIHYARMIVAFVFGDLDEAMRCLRFCSSLVNNPTGAGDSTMPCLIDGLMSIEIYRRHGWKVGLLCRIRKRIRQLRRFAVHSPLNYLGKLYLVQAEFASLQGRSQRAYLKYISAISLYGESGVNLQLGLANELAGKHFLRLNETVMAIRFLKEAERVYRNWGGHAKADHLVAEVKLW
jgi:tetratricopeptide (TPR) repeat protein